MKTFNVLDRHLAIHQNFLLEASAGTGKTFSIQNIVVRLLIESRKNESPMTIDQILVVTFTRAAARDLKKRIRTNIEQALAFLEDAIIEKSDLKEIPDYLSAIIENGRTQQAKKLLQQALFSFDQAQIFTIHSFCSRKLKEYALECDMGFDAHHLEEGIPSHEIMRIVKDFFKTEVRPEIYCLYQLNVVFKEDPNHRKLLKALQANSTYKEDIPTFHESYAQFCKEMQKIKQELDITSKFLIEDFKAQYESYKNYKSGLTKPEILSRAIRFATLFDCNTWTYSDFEKLLEDSLIWIEALDPILLKNRVKVSEKLNYPSFRNRLQEKMEEIISLANSFSALLARMSRDCQKLLKKFREEEEKINPDDLLNKVEEALVARPLFSHQIKSAYQAAIIDEFQDTDPQQWRIFRNLFLSHDGSWKGNIYLVGDPKQSIYSFRQADIYTYLAAAKALGNESIYSLETNFRSTEPLVESLNKLFAKEYIPDFIYLPKMQYILPYQSVKAGASLPSINFQDEKGSIHFFIGSGMDIKKTTLKKLEDKIFFPFIANEIESLIKKSSLQYNQIAILVRDRHQGTNLSKHLQARQIPYINQKTSSLIDSQALSALTDFIAAVLDPHHLKLLKVALGGQLIGWSSKKFIDFEPPHHVLMGMQRLKHLFQEKGFSSFYHELLNSDWLSEDTTILNRLLAREGGIDFYNDLQQIADIIVDRQDKEWCRPDELIPFLDQFLIEDSHEDPRFKRIQDHSKVGVKILSLHSSKGLEFDVVFALGLINRSQMTEDLIPAELKNENLFIPVIGPREKYKTYFEEQDAEKMRQLYVALTRAKYRVYIPAAFSMPQTDLNIGEASPMDLFLAKLNKNGSSYEQLYAQIKENNSEKLINFLDEIGKNHPITYSVHNEVEYDPLPAQTILGMKLIPPVEIKIQHKPWQITSFSRLTAHLEWGVEDKKKSIPHDYQNSEKTTHTLPASNETGLFLHEILENISFESFKNLPISQTYSHLQPLLQNSKFENWDSVINSIVFNVMNTVIFTDYHSFYFAELSHSHIYREMPFLFSYDDTIEVEGIQLEKGFIKGVIDLVCCYGDKYYIIDWKSNWLGPSIDSYERENLHQAMLQNNYFLQAFFYRLALEKYLKLVEPRLFSECFGGTIYIFLRGLKPGSQTGLYYINNH